MLTEPVARLASVYEVTHRSVLTFPSAGFRVWTRSIIVTINVQNIPKPADTGGVPPGKVLESPNLRPNRTLSPWFWRAPLAAAGWISSADPGLISPDFDSHVFVPQIFFLISQI